MILPSLSLFEVGIFFLFSLRSKGNRYKSITARTIGLLILMIIVIHFHKRIRFFVPIDSLKNNTFKTMSYGLARSLFFIVEKFLGNN